jgi:ABC-type phosphate/phosphonate transport system substrate-binding protein
VFLESQDRIMAALLAGEVAAGGLKETLYQKFRKENLRIVATSDQLPNFALCALPSFPEKARDRLLAALLRLKPLASKADAETVTHWDDEIKNGFSIPDEHFLPAIINFYSTYWEVTNASR